MNRIRVGLVGSTGRMGRSILQILEGEPNFGDRFQLVYASSGPKDPEFAIMGRELPEVVIDFSGPETSLAAAELCAKNRVPLLVGTTGFTAEQMQKLEATMKGLHWALTPNTSLGVYVLQEALRAALPYLPESFSVSIVEAHHSLKKDKPSGTAKALAETVNSARGPMPDMHSLRGGTEVGEHSVIILGPGERLEFNHRALDRSLFARGALELAGRLVKLSKAKPAPAQPWNSADLFKA